MTDIGKILSARQGIHGAFEDDARYSQSIKAVVQSGRFERINRGQPDLRYTQTEALEHIATKIGRILAGDANEQDHWDDIAGYATLVSNEIAVMKDKLAVEADQSKRASKVVPMTEPGTTS